MVNAVQAGTFGRKIQGKANQRGFTALELTVALIVIGLGIAAVVLSASSIFTNQAVNTETSRLQFMTNKLGGYLTNSVDTSGVSTANTITIGAVSPDAVSGTSILSKLGGTVTVAPANLSGTNDAFAFTYNTVKSSACIPFVKNNGATFDTITVNGTSVKAATATTVTDATLNTACTNTNTIVFTKSKA